MLALPAPAYISRLPARESGMYRSAELLKEGCTGATRRQITLTLRRLPQEQAVYKSNCIRETVRDRGSRGQRRAASGAQSAKIASMHSEQSFEGGGDKHHPSNRANPDSTR
jgi:hypothetical protein